MKAINPVAFPFKYNQSLRGFKPENFRSGQEKLTSAIYTEFANKFAKISDYSINVSNMNNRVFKKRIFATFLELEKHLSDGWTAWIKVPYDEDGHYVTAISVRVIIENGLKVKYIQTDDPLNGFGKLYKLGSISLEKSWAIVI